MNRRHQPPLPLYQRLKNYIVAQVESGAWLPGHRIRSLTFSSGILHPRGVVIVCTARTRLRGASRVTRQRG